VEFSLDYLVLFVDMFELFQRVFLFFYLLGHIFELNLILLRIAHYIQRLLLLILYLLHQFQLFFSLPNLLLIVLYLILQFDNFFILQRLINLHFCVICLLYHHFGLALQILDFNLIICFELV